MTLSAGWLNILSGFVLHDLNSSFVSRKMRNIALHLDDLKTLIRPQTKINHVIIRKKIPAAEEEICSKFRLTYHWIKSLSMCPRKKECVD